MREMMNMENMVWMMGGMGLIGFLVLVLLMFGIAALIKYLFFGKRENTKS